MVFLSSAACTDVAVLHRTNRSLTVSAAINYQLAVHSPPIQFHEAQRRIHSVNYCHYYYYCKNIMHAPLQNST